VAAILAVLPLACARSTEQAEGGSPPARGAASSPAGAPVSEGPAGLQEGRGGRIGPLPKGEGTRRMAERLEALNAAARPGVNPFLNAERAAQIKETLPRIADPLDRMLATTQMADELLRAGRIQEAMDTVTPLLTPPAADAQYAPPPIETREFLGLCWLRMGETANCIRDHTIESCLLPIRGGGVHAQKEGSRRALEEFAQVLRARPDDLGTRWLYNLAAMTLGEYPDKVPPEWRIPPEIFKSEADIGRFTDVAPTAGVDVRQHAGGAIMDDFDGDGLLDLFVSSMGLHDPLHFFHNRGDGTFEDRSEAAGLTTLVGGLNVIHADYDNDGDNDVVVLRGGWMQKGGRFPTSLLRNNGDGTFDDVTEEAGILSLHPTQTGAFADYDGDGWLDLVIGREDMPDDPHPTELWRNNGDGTFSDRSLDLAADTRFGYVKGVVWGDYNNDGRPDLFVSVLSRESHLFRNDGPVPGAKKFAAAGWRFTDVTRETGITRPANSFPTWWWDYDNDGWLDLLVAGFKFNDMTDLIAFQLGRPTRTALPSLFRNNHDGTFTDVAHAARIDRVALPMGSNYGDVDGDGWPDCYFGDGEPGFRSLIPNRMFRNDRGRVFQDVTHSAGVGHIQKGHGVAMGDIDNDGDLDVFEEMGGWYQADVAHATLYRNPGHPGNHWITLRLEGAMRGAGSTGSGSNRSAIGARIRVRVRNASGTRDLYAVVGSGGSFGGNSLQAEIGLGPARSIEEIAIGWPTTGRTETVRDVAMDRVYRFVEGSGRLEPVTLKKIPL